MTSSSRLLSRAETAKLLGIKESTLAAWKSNGRYGLKYIKIGRLVKYRLSDIEEFIQRRTENGGQV